MRVWGLPWEIGDLCEKVRGQEKMKRFASITMSNLSPRDVYGVGRFVDVDL